MTAAALEIVGLVLCFLGAVSVRIAVLAAGFGATWLLADALDASTGTTLLLAACGAAAAFVVTLLISKVLLFVAGAVVGAVLGARIFVIVGGEGNWALATAFVPSVAVVCGFLADRFRKRFLVWATALAGAILIVSGVGRLTTGTESWFWRPDTILGSVLFAVLVVLLTAAGHHTQSRDRRTAKAPPS